MLVERMCVLCSVQKFRSERFHRSKCLASSRDADRNAFKSFHCSCQSVSSGYIVQYPSKLSAYIQAVVKYPLQLLERIFRVCSTVSVAVVRAYPQGIINYQLELSERIVMFIVKDNEMKFQMLSTC
jgi:hypothetical protein